MQNIINLYKVSDRYLNYLQQFDSRVSSHNSAEGGTYVGTILKTTDGILYFVPLSSYKPNKEARMRNRQQITIYLHEDGNNNNKLGYLLLNNMIPVPGTELTLVDLSDQSIPKNRMMLLQQIYIRRNSEKIKRKAAVVYRKQIEGNPYFRNWCCDFKLLEERHNDYIDFTQNQIQVSAENGDLDLNI